MKHLLSILPALILASACVGDETVRAYGGADKTWVLESLDGEAFDVHATLTFPEPGRIAGQAPCNAYTGKMEAAYPWWETSGLIATRMACPEMRAESAFLAALAAMTEAEVLGDTLILRGGKSREMVFKTAP